MPTLTGQEKIFVKNVIATGNNTKAVIKAFPDIKSKKYARVKGHRLITKDNIQKAIKSIADSLSDKELIKVHKQGLKATYQKKPDYAVRHKYLDSAYKLKKLYEEGGTSKPITVVIPIQLAQSFNINGTHTETSRGDIAQGEIQTS